MLLADPERARKSDFRPKERMSSVEKRRSFGDWMEGVLGAGLEGRAREESEGLREPGREADWDRGDLLEEEESARRRKTKGRSSFQFGFGVFLEGVSCDRRTVGVERALERVESRETEGERAMKSSFRGIGCVADLVSDCGSSDGAQWPSRRSLLGSGRGAKRMRRVEGAEEAG